jgi:MFS family permease
MSRRYHANTTRSAASCQSGLHVTREWDEALLISKRLTGLWRHPDFVRLWAAQTVSMFGSLITQTALPFVAILVLHARPFQVAMIGVAGLVPAFLVGLVAGAWVDRLHRRPILIAADLGRAVTLAIVPVCALFDVLRIEIVYAVAALTSVLSVFFDVAYQSYLPSLVRREELVEGNSKLTASASVAEFSAFSVGGWLVQWLTAPYALVVDALTFLWSAFFVSRIQQAEPPPMAEEEREPILHEINAGLQFVTRHPVLRPLGTSTAIFAFSGEMFGAVFMFYVASDLDFKPGILGVIFAVGGFSSLIGAITTARLTRRIGVGPALIVALPMIAIGRLLVVAATDSSWIAIALLVGQQFVTDPFWTTYEITNVSLRQSITPDRWQGRMNASLRSVDFGGMLLGALIGGWLGDELGARTTLLVASLIGVLAAIPLMVPAVRNLKDESVTLTPVEPHPSELP